MTRIGVFGGSFNPVHNGHVIMALCAREVAALDTTLIVPAALSPHKSGADMLPSSLRIACLRAAFDGLEGFTVDTREVQRGDVSYTVETLESVTRQQPGADLFCIVGGDSLESLHQWRDAPRLAQLATFLWIERPGSDPALADAARDALPGLRLQKVGCPRIEISASAVRTRRAAGLPLSGWVPDAVANLLAGSGP